MVGGNTAPSFLYFSLLLLSGRQWNSESGFASGHNGGDSRHAPLFMLSILGLSPEPYVDHQFANSDNGPEASFAQWTLSPTELFV